MIELLRNCSHESEVATYLKKRDTRRGKKIIKVATTERGIRNLNREINGWKWYRAIRYPEKKYPICQILRQKDSYLKIGIEFIEGNRIDYRKGLAKNAKIVRRITEHYCYVWSHSEDIVFPFHGDLSPDNIIYNGEGVHIIDWEHFSLEGAPWGTDIVYMLFETLYFFMLKNKRHLKSEIDTIAENLKFVNSYKKLCPQVIESPLSFLKEFITDNLKLWGEHLTTLPKKLPIFTFTDAQTNLIDDMVSSKLRKVI